MATKKDLTEAYAFSRRRLVTAFVSGAPGGREVEPARPGRTIVGGLALAVLLIAGAAVAGIFSPRVDENWASNPGLIISRESGAAYVITDVQEGEDPVLRPVINITSARLILGATVEPTIIPDEYINQEQRGDDIGILGAPANVPDPDRLIDDGWTVCSDPDTGLQVSVTRADLVDPVSLGGLLVRVAGQRGDDVYVIAEGRAADSDATRAYSYRLPDTLGRDNMLSGLNLPDAGSAVEVPEEWLSLFPEGGDLTRDAFGLENEGQPADYAQEEPGLENAVIGDVVTTPSESLLLTQDGPALLDPFALAVYVNSGASTVSPLVVDVPPALTRAPEPYEDASWPAEIREQVLGEQCVRLETEPGAQPEAHLVQNPQDSASAAAVPLGRKDIAVDDGAGAYVESGSWDQTTAGDPHLIDPKGFRYPMVGPDTADRLGYGDYRVAIVPDAWIELFRGGVALSENAALCTPTDDQEEQSCA